jgi:deoxycytidylate deaminase
MKGIHRTPKDPRMWDEFLLDQESFEREKQRVTREGIEFLPNYEFDECGNVHIEDYSDLKNYTAVREIEKWMNYAAGIAVDSVCQKSQRGAIVVRGNYVLGGAYSGPISGEACRPCLRKDIYDNTGFEQCNGVHAEGTAVKNAEKTGNLDGSRLYYVKTRGGVIIPSGDYACTECSKLILGSGIEEVVLWHKDTHLKDEQLVPEPNADDGFLTIGIQTAHFVVYSAGKLHELALEYVKRKK